MMNYGKLRDLTDEGFDLFINELNIEDFERYNRSKNHYDYEIIYSFRFEKVKEKFIGKAFSGEEEEVLFNATFNGRLVVRDFLPIDDLIKIYKEKAFISDYTIENSKYSNLLKATKMEYGACEKYGFKVIGWRPRMSYMDGFKYGDMFEPADKIALLIRKNQDLIKINKCWQFKYDHDIILVSSPGFNFLITVQDLADSLGLGLDSVARWLPIV